RQMEGDDKPRKKIGQVVHTLHPVRPLRGPEARMRGGIDVKVLRQSLVKLEPPGIPPGAVEYQQRGPLSAVQQLHPQASNGDLFFPPITCHVVSPPSASQVRRFAPLVGRSNYRWTARKRQK